MELSQSIIDMIDCQTEDYYICYFDVLGYKATIKESTNQKKFLVTMLFSKDSILSVIRNHKGNLNIECRTYSDNFLIYLKKDGVEEYEALNRLCSIVRRIQVLLLMNHEVLIRGGITVGSFFCNDKIVFGEGLINAVELETKIAKNPRIVIDSNAFVSENLDLLRRNSTLVEDADGQLYINYFFDRNALQLIQGVCKKLVSKNCTYPANVKDEIKIREKEKTISKMVWLLVHFNKECEITENEDLKIPYKLKINERLLKMEITTPKNK